MNSSKLSHFLPCDPISEFFEEETTFYGPSPEFCAEWNPDFLLNGRQCCANLSNRFRKKKFLHSPILKRKRGNSCSDMTEEQKAYKADVLENRLGDLLTYLTREIRNDHEQAFCTVNNGFLAFGRIILPTPENRLLMKSADRCLNFGTDLMAGMLEWVGREVGKKYFEEAYSKVRLVIGNISAPRGGMLVGRSGIIGHLSHTSGQDVDIGFLTAKKGKESPVQFHTQFEPEPNWWLLKQIFKNPFGCVKVIFLDRKHIRSLEKTAKKDSDWKTYRRFVRHVPGHKHHFHVRIGDLSGEPGCTFNSQPEPEPEENLKLSLQD